MKTKILILLSVLSLSIASQAQITIALKPLKQFGGDTLAFINANFAPEVRLYEEGRNLKIFIEEMNQELPIKAFRILPAMSSDGSFGVVDFYYYDIKEIKSRNKRNIKVPSVQFNCNIISLTNPLYKEIQKMGIDMSGKLMPWDKKYLEVFNKLETDYFVPCEYFEITSEYFKKSIYLLPR